MSVILRCRCCGGEMILDPCEHGMIRRHARCIECGYDGNVREEKKEAEVVVIRRRRD